MSQSDHTQLSFALLILSVVFRVFCIICFNDYTSLCTSMLFLRCWLAFDMDIHAAIIRLTSYMLFLSIYLLVALTFHLLVHSCRYVESIISDSTSLFSLIKLIHYYYISNKSLVL